MDKLNDKSNDKLNDKMTQLQEIHDKSMNALLAVWCNRNGCTPLIDPLANPERNKMLWTVAKDHAIITKWNMTFVKVPSPKDLKSITKEEIEANHAAFIKFRESGDPKYQDWYTGPDSLPPPTLKDIIAEKIAAVNLEHAKWNNNFGKLGKLDEVGTITSFDPPVRDDWVNTLGATD